MPDTSLLDARLAEIDERLRALQSGLDATDGAADEPTGHEAPLPPPSPPTPLRDASTPAPVETPADAERLLAALHELSETHGRLLELHRELLSQYAELLERRVTETASVPIVAGPFVDGSALRGFERELRRLPGVTEVTIREFLSGDRVAIDVRLAGR